MFLGMYYLTDARLFLRAQSPFARTDDGWNSTFAELYVSLNLPPWPQYQGKAES